MSKQKNHKREYILHKWTKTSKIWISFRHSS